MENSLNKLSYTQCHSCKSIVRSYSLFDRFITICSSCSRNKISAKAIEELRKPKQLEFEFTHVINENGESEELV
jgi:hypothetical protein